ncbi:hypothetical protein [Candidatus Palauibacter sp.]|uniref:hypothetical protein n=1 Tax=Candidatus Palauibacter sp. TaxID=3101350 RepID=UPI003B51BAEE
MNESEELFRRFCEFQGWRVERIDAHSMPHGSSVPDFRIVRRSSRGIVVEVKQFDPNEEEQEAQRRLEAGGRGSLSGTPGKRLRGVISKANKQLKALGASEPGMLVVHNRTRNWLHDDPDSVRTAMHGLDVIDVYVPAGHELPPAFGPRRPGPGKKLTADMNTSVSCVAVLRESWSASSAAARGRGYALEVY